MTTAVVIVFVCVIELEVCVYGATECTVCVSPWFYVHVCVHGFASSNALFLLCVCSFLEQAFSLGPWGGVLSIDFVWFKA